MSNRLSKPFDPKLFKENDNKGREIVRKYLEGEGYLVVNNPNQYEADLLVMEQDPETKLWSQIALAEVGVRTSWKSHEWPAKWDLRIEQRKAKYLKHGIPVWFFVLNEMGTAVVVPKFKLTDYKIIEVNNRYFKDKKESNYSIPANQMDYYEIVPKITVPNTDEDLI